MHSSLYHAKSGIWMDVQCHQKGWKDERMEVGNTDRRVSMMILNKQFTESIPRKSRVGPIGGLGGLTSERVLIESPQMLGWASDHLVDQMR